MHPRKKAAHRRDRIRAFWVAAVLLLICGGSVYMSKVIKPTDRSRSDGWAGHASGKSDEPGDNDRTSGSVLFVPQEGNRCRQRVIDNKTWSIRDKGYVTCDEDVSWNANIQSKPTYSAASRVDAIRSGFFKK